MKKFTVGGLLLVAGVLSAMPVTVYAEGEEAAQRLASLKQVKQQGLEGRLNILQQERACVMAAASMEALHACDEMSRQMMDRMQEQQKASWENLKANSQPDKDRKR